MIWSEERFAHSWEISFEVNMDIHKKGGGGLEVLCTHAEVTLESIASWTLAKRLYYPKKTKIYTSAPVQLGYVCTHGVFHQVLF